MGHSESKSEVESKSGSLPDWAEGNPRYEAAIESPELAAVWNKVYPGKDLPETANMGMEKLDFVSMEDALDIFSAAKEVGASRGEAAAIFDVVLRIGQVNRIMDDDPYAKMIDRVYEPDSPAPPPDPEIAICPPPLILESPAGDDASG